MSGHNKHLALAIALTGVTTLAPRAEHAEAAQPAPIVTPGTVPHGPSPAEPHVLTGGGVADVIVRIRGGLCTGTPITGTRYVVTAAHCVLTSKGKVTKRVAVRGEVVYEPVAILVDTQYHDTPRVRYDAAVLVLEEPIPGPSARLGRAVPTSGNVTLAGLQPVDTDGTLLRGDSPDDRPRPKSASGDPVKIESRPAGCVEPARDLKVAPDRVTVHCGLVPGSSGGGLFAEENGEHVLVGIISTVSADVSSNGVVPLASLHELLNNQAEYMHPLDEDDDAQRAHRMAVLT